MNDQNNRELQLASDFVRYTNRNIFLTGKAGTGKTTFLKNLKSQTFKRMIVVAPTGVAAINAGGVTIHSFFQLSFGPQVPSGASEQEGMTASREDRPGSFHRFRGEKVNMIRSLDLLIIDEISMVRADLLDAVDEVLRRFRNRYLPFGGVQLLMIGDLQQLAPVVREDEWELLKPYYDTCYFFSSRALREAGFISIELKHIFRQQDAVFIGLLNKIRNNQADSETLFALNQRYLPGFQPDEDEKYITLTTHNYQAKAINQSKLQELKGKMHRSKALIRDEFPEYLYPTEPELELKVGAQVMFVRNDSSPDKRYYNGKIGAILKIESDNLLIQCPDSIEPIQAVREEWENISYSLNPETQAIEEKVLGTFEQFPLKLAWAITIHKSQGLTFEKAIINARQSFASGQVYVALSRCKSLEGLVLSAPIDARSIQTDETVRGFTESVTQKLPDRQTLLEEKHLYQRQLLKELFDFDPLLHLIRYLLKLCREQGALLLGDLPNRLSDMIHPLRTDMIGVAEKFGNQVRQLLDSNPDAEHNELLQERVRKACSYYLDKLNTVIIDPIREVNFETDNKAVRKSLQKGMDNLQREITIRKSSLESCRDGFVPEHYLRARALSSMNIEKITGFHSGSSTFSTRPDFYKKLHGWRARKATEEETEVSRILPQKTMIAIADSLPVTRLELKNIPGMGGVRLQLFGKEILEMVIAYRREKGMDLPMDAEKEAAAALLDTKQLSYALFKTGKTIPEIAVERQMALSTIEGHLAWFISTGDLSVDRVLPADKKEALLPFIRSHPGLGFAEIRNAMGKQYSYADIRFVTGHLQYLKQTKETK
jgi:GTPase SAR1 family protein